MPDDMKTVFGCPPDDAIGEVMPKWQRIFLGAFMAAAGVGMFALVLWTLEKIFFLDK